MEKAYNMKINYNKNFSIKNLCNNYYNDFSNGHISTNNVNTNEMMKTN